VCYRAAGPPFHLKSDIMKCLLHLHSRSTGCILLLAAIAWGCVSTSNPDVERGSMLQYREGYPEVRLSAIGILDEQNNPMIYVSSDIVYGSLIYKKKNEFMSADIDIEVQITKQGEDKTVVQRKNYSRNIRSKDPNIIHDQQVITFEDSLFVKPGDYKIFLSVRDKSSEKRTTRMAETYIPDPENNVSNLTNIQMQGKDMDDAEPRWYPITTYDVAGKIDSLKFIFQVTNNNTEEPLTIEGELLRFRSDTTIARPMHYNNLSSSNIEHRGIDYDKTEVLETSTRLLSQPGSVLIEYKFARQPRGNYRFEAKTGKEGVEEFEAQTKARDFGVKSENYPAILTARELARPLRYLMDEDEYEELIKQDNSDSLKQDIDRFWLKNIKNANKAKSVIKMYYQRVEEANKQFSNFKEGWKTDPGMIYILFGPPWYVNQRLDFMQWSYSYNRNNPEFNFVFRQPKLQSEFYPFEHFVLQRNQFYYSVQFQQRDLWLTGQILNRNI